MFGDKLAPTFPFPGFLIPAAHFHRAFSLTTRIIIPLTGTDRASSMGATVPACTLLTRTGSSTTM